MFSLWDARWKKKNYLIQLFRKNFRIKKLIEKELCDSRDKNFHRKRKINLLVINFLFSMKIFYRAISKINVIISHDFFSINFLIGKFLRKRL